MRTARVYSLLAAVTAGLFAAGCATKQGRSVTPAEKGDAAILGDYGALLQEGKGDEALLRYDSPAAKWSDYKKVIVMPVKFQKPEKASQGDLEDLQKLADSAHLHFTQQLGQDFEIVTDAGPGTMRLETALYDAKKKKVVLNFISGFTPIGIAVNTAAVAARGKPMAVGEISGEMKVTDASSGELLFAAVDRRVGRKYQKSALSSWGEADDAIEYWSKRSRYVLCQKRGMTGCVEP